MAMATSGRGSASGGGGVDSSSTPLPLVKYLLSSSKGGGGGVNNSSSLLMDHGPLQQDPIRVCLRLRPMTKFELNRRSVNCCQTSTSSSSSSSNKSSSNATSCQHDENENDAGSSSTNNCIHIHSPLDGKFQFVFDKIFSAAGADAAAEEDGENSTQLQLYQHAVAPLALHAMEGYSCACIAYGQTGSGKTYTMMGGASSASNRSVCIASSSSGTDADGFIDSTTGADGGSTTEGIAAAAAAAGGCGGVHLLNASEACCYSASDVLSLLVRGNACRTVSSTKLNTDSSRSHAIFIVKLEQKDSITGITKVSQVQLIDMAGSELARSSTSTTGAGGGGETNGEDDAIHQEGTMINKSISLLHTIVKMVGENQNGQKRNEGGGGGVGTGGKGGGNGGGGMQELLPPPHRQSKLTQLLQEVFGGNCRTSIILTASPASYNIAETIRTAKFGQLCQRVHNYIQPNVEMSPLDYRKLLNDSQKKQGYLVDLVNELSAECFQLKQDAKKSTFDEAQYTGPLWKTIEAILVDGASPVVNKLSSSSNSSSSGGGVGQGHLLDSTTTDNAVIALREELSKTRDELARSILIRQKLEDSTAERLSEVSVLRTQNDIYASDKKKFMHELVVMKNEIRHLTQRTQEVEHNLRTSQFREYEATVFLRQFRRFYRRLLRNKAHQGTGKTSDVIERVPGVPDLNDLIDVDSLLLEAGLIEDSELHDDTATGAYRPSAQALTRSTDAANKAWKEAELLGKVSEVEAFDRSASRVVGGYKQVNYRKGDDDGNEDGIIIPNGQSISHRQQFLSTPAGRLTTMHERDLERDLLSATERCIDLQVALNEEKSNVEILTNRAGNANKLKFAQECTRLKQQLDKKTHDLQAIIWKMNELHLINKTYNEKMSAREHHVTYLEENLVELQTAYRTLILERQEAEGALRSELDNLKVLVDAMTVPLWQFGECGIPGKTLTSRICLPVCGRDGMDVYEDDDDGGVESLESAEESVNSMDEEDDDDDEEEESEDEAELDAVVVSGAKKAVVPVREASTQTDIPLGEKGTMTDNTMETTPTLAVPQAPLRQNDVATTMISSYADNTLAKKMIRGNPSPNATTAPDEAASFPSKLNRIFDQQQYDDLE
ncbi:hypothetical protein ACHAWU_007378 [Discostella pseudostelligera]|uniref:Kinesin motor domain-containing protein n=1 Tax=Discostella pseudostelligera TaxID=259834 RepID=A0ABD3MBN9_9STRA